MEKVIVDENLASRRLDEVLVSLGISLSRSKAQSLIKSGGVLVNNKAQKAHYILKLSDVITYQETTNLLPTLEAEPIPLDVIYEDEDILIINKPAGMVVHPAPGHYSGTVVNALLARNMTLANTDNPLRPGIVHRIDKDTSGLLCIAKNDAAMLDLQKQLSTHSMHREYIALVKDTIYEDDGKIDATTGRHKRFQTTFAIDNRNATE